MERMGQSDRLGTRRDVDRDGAGRDMLGQADTSGQRKRVEESTQQQPVTTQANTSALHDWAGEDIVTDG